MIRDNAMDLAHEDRPINGLIIIHHIVPITIEDVLQRHPNVFDENNLISTSSYTHRRIHYSIKNSIIPEFVLERKEGDTCPWR